eukprot:15872392-Heterocapsa_arctica.AAC.1
MAYWPNTHGCWGGATRLSGAVLPARGAARGVVLGRLLPNQLKPCSLLSPAPRPCSASSARYAVPCGAWCRGPP